MHVADRTLFRLESFIIGFRAIISHKNMQKKKPPPLKMMV